MPSNNIYIHRLHFIPAHKQCGKICFATMHDFDASKTHHLRGIYVHRSRHCGCLVSHVRTRPNQILPTYLPDESLNLDLLQWLNKPVCCHFIGRVTLQLHLYPSQPFLSRNATLPLHIDGLRTAVNLKVSGQWLSTFTVAGVVSRQAFSATSRSRQPPSMPGNEPYTPTRMRTMLHTFVAWTTIRMHDHTA